MVAAVATGVLTVVAMVGVAGQASSAAALAPHLTTPALTVDCTSLAGDHYASATATVSLTQLQPGAAYTLHNEHLTGNTSAEDLVHVVADPQGAATVSATLTGSFVASGHYVFRVVPDAADNPFTASVDVTSSACDSGVSSAGTSSIGFRCADRYWTAAGENGTSFHFVAALTGFVPGTGYTLTVPGAGYRQASAVAGSDGHLTFDVTLANNLATTRVPTAWSLSTPSQGQDVATGTATIAACPPIVRSTKRAALTHDGDVTGDGYGDLMAVDWSGRLWLYTNGIRSNAGHVPFSNGRVIGYGWANNGPLQVVRQGDLTGDGYTDLVAIRSDGALVAYYNNINSTTARLPYSSAVVIGTGWLPFLRFAVTDVNGDGYADIVATTSDGSAYYYQNRYASDPQHRPFSSGVRLVGATLYADGSLGGADINGDGYGDVVDDGMGVNPSRVPAGSPVAYTTFYTGIDPNKIAYNVTNAYAGWAAGHYEGRGSAGVVFASPDNDGRLIYAKDPGVSSTGSVIGAGWQMFAFLVH
ncbi:hypothetical protein DOE76_01965 [Leifsonia sp. ku-ls]|nr:hypothetical protein DOE76_01965 [Leifsonia sp. ku-ls]